MKKHSYSKINAYIISHIDLSGYDEYAHLVTDNESSLDRAGAKLKALYEIFLAEVGNWRIPQSGLQTALMDWLEGLPSAIDLPFYDGDIIQLAKDTDGLPQDATEKQEQGIIDNYWRFMAMRIISLWQSAKIKLKRV